MKFFILSCFQLAVLLLSVNGFSQQTIFSTDFQQGIPSSCAIVENDFNIPAAQVSEYNAAWIAVVDPENPIDTVAGSTSFFEPTGTASRWLITPQLALGSYGNFIQWNARSQDASWPDDYLVLISTTNNNIGSFTDTIGYIIEENVEWTTRQVNLTSNGYANQNVYIAFVNVTNDGFKLYLDDISVRVDDPVGIAQTDLNQFNVYPNPSTGIFNVSSNASIDRILVSDLLGNSIYTTVSTAIDLSGFPNGIYFLNVYSGSTNQVIRIEKY